MSIHLSRDIEEQLRRLARERGADVDALAHQAVEQYLVNCSLSDVTAEDVAQSQGKLAAELPGWSQPPTDSEPSHRTGRQAFARPQDDFAGQVAGRARDQRHHNQVRAGFGKDRMTIRSVIRRAIVFLFFGAIVNVAVAWGSYAARCIPSPSIEFRCYEGGYQVSGWPATSLRQNYLGAHVFELASDSVPRLPIWPGFAINTIFYAALLWMAFTFPLVLRRHRRLNRGLCRACAYPIGASEICTECGKPVM